MTKQEFISNILKIYPESKLKIIEWNGFTREIKFECDKCGEIHTLKNARNILETQTYCSKEKVKNTKWGQEEFQKRLWRLFNLNIEIVDYNGLSNPIKYKCPFCGEIKTCRPARQLFTRSSLCDKCFGREKNIVKRKIDNLFSQSDKYELLIWRGVKKKLTEKCLNCGTVFDRWPHHVIQSFDFCPICRNARMKQMLDKNEVQRRIDQSFGKEMYELLEYKEQLNKHNKIRCLSCGLIFETQIPSFVDRSRGCPKCKRFKSKGEQKVQQYLEQNNISFTPQKRFPECNHGLSSFDFCAYTKEGQMVLIEVNGIQHYKQVIRFGSLEKIRRRDNIKINFCRENNIPLVIIPYYKLKDSDIDEILSFLKGSTTIPSGSRE